MEVLYFWLILFVIFLIIELMTTVFYGLALALASAIVASVVFFFPEGQERITILQAVVFLISAVVFSFLLPKLLKSKQTDVPQGMDRYIGMKRKVKKSGSDFKVTLDGVDYLIENEEEVETGDLVEVIGHAGVSVTVKKI